MVEVEKEGFVVELKTESKTHESQLFCKHTEHEADFNGFNVYYDDNQLNKCEVEVDYKTKKSVK